MQLCKPGNTYGGHPHQASLLNGLPQALPQVLTTLTKKRLCLSCLNSTSLAGRLMWRKSLGQQTARILHVRLRQISGAPWFSVDDRFQDSLVLFPRSLRIARVGKYGMDGASQVAELNIHHV